MCVCVRARANNLVDWSSIPGQVILKTQKCYLMPPWLTLSIMIRIKGKVEQSRERSSTLPYTWWISYWKGSLRITLDYGWPNFNNKLYIYKPAHWPCGYSDCRWPGTTRVQSQVGSYQRLKKSYSIPPCLTLGIMRYVSRVKGSNPG